MMLTPVDSPMQAIQDFIQLRPGEYAVVHNPASSFEEDYPNGKYSSGRGDMKDLAKGTKRVITQGHFPVWPGQKVEVRNMHYLSSSQFIMVAVESDKIDEKAPYYELTVKCARIRKAVVDETVGSQDEDESIKTGDITVDGAATGAGAEGEQAARDETSGPAEEQTNVQSQSPASTDSTPAVKAAAKESTDEMAFRVGQRIIIPGSLTPTYIPPSGIEVVSEDCETDTNVLDDRPAQEVIEGAISTGVLKIENIQGFLEQANLDRVYKAIYSGYQGYRQSNQSGRSLLQAIRDYLDRGELQELADVLRVSHAAAVSELGVVREAVVLSPTQHCVLLDEDGNPRTKQGPGRVFPGPNDRFRTEGSRERIYDDYHIRSDRGILLRVVANSISKQDLAGQLPNGSKLDKDRYVKGDEIFIGGFDAYLVPSNSIEVINPETRQPHIGNDHSEVYVKAIGVDQKSGVYVASVETGNVQLVKGEKKLLLDPRKERHQLRNVSGRLWNLMIAQGEPHKTTQANSLVETPWALSVTVPNNMSALVVSKDSRRPIVGPGMELLGYEETLEALRLSRGKPKSDVDLLETCFLRVTGNRISDQVDLETSDNVVIRVDVYYGVEFVGETDAERIKWFNHRDYVKLLCTSVRSRLRAAARQMKLTELYADVAGFIRDTVLGVKPSGEGVQHRPNLKFSENNMLVNEVEVLSIRIPDDTIEQTLIEANREVVTTTIEDTTAAFQLDSAKRRDEMAGEQTELDKTQLKREQELALAHIEDVDLREKKIEGLAHSRALTGQQRTQDLSEKQTAADDKLATLQRVRDEADAASKLKIKDELRTKVVDFRKAIAEIQKDLTGADADAIATKLEAVQPQLIAAIDSLGDKQALAALAEHLPEATGELGFLLGQGGLAGLQKLVEGTPFGKAIEALGVTSNQVEAAAEKEAATDASDVEVDETSKD
jgi:major vault protein